MAKLKTGDKVRLTGEFLRNTGQMAGGEGQSKWTVQDCSCRLCEGGKFVLTDEISKYYVPNDGELGKYRHINTGNLQKCK